MYLGLGVDATQIQTQYPMHPTQETRKDLQSYILTGLSPSTVRPFQVNFSLTKEDPNQVQNTTSPRISQYGIQFVLHRFRSPLLTISLLLSLPPPTKMFQFSGFPILNGSNTKVFRKSH